MEKYSNIYGCMYKYMGTSGLQDGVSRTIEGEETHGCQTRRAA
jgi:hypothetical protein